MFDISTKLVSEKDEISGLETTGWENHSWRYLSLIGDERIINLQRTKVYVISDSVLRLGEIHENTESNTAWEQSWSGPKEHLNTETWTELMESQWNSSDLRTLQLSQEVKEFTVEIEWDTREFHRKAYLQVDVQRHLMGIKREQERMRVK